MSPARRLVMPLVGLAVLSSLGVMDGSSSTAGTTATNESEAVTSHSLVLADVQTPIDPTPTPTPTPSATATPTPEPTPAATPVPSIGSGASLQVLRFTTQPAANVTTAIVALVAATSSSRLPVTITPSGPCTINQGIVSFSAPGTCVLTASQPGDDVFAPASAISTSTLVSVPREALPQISAASKKGNVTLTGQVDPRYSGHTFSYFVRSGLTGKVASLGAAQVNASGTAKLAIKAAVGRVVSSYGRIVGAQADRAYTRTLTFRVS